MGRGDVNDSTTEAIAQGYVDALLAHDEETAFAHFRETAAIVVSGRHMLAGTFATPRHYRETRQWIFREHDAGIDLTRCDALLARGDLAVALVEERAHRGENVLTYGVVLIFHVVDGAVTELRIIAEDSYALDRFWE